jgi:hypothetical protein
MLSVQLDASTKLDNFKIITEIGITDDYLKQHATEPESRQLTTHRNGFLESPFVERVWASPSFWRLHANFAEDAAKYTYTYATMDWTIGADDLEKLGKQSFMLRGYIDQPALNSLSLYSRFVAKVGALRVPENDMGKAAKAGSDKAGKTWTTMKPLPCSENPPPRKLLLDLGTHAGGDGPE